MTKLAVMLCGLEAGEPQAVANMQMVPLVGQGLEPDAIGTVEDMYLKRDVAYDKLNIGNKSDVPAILPNGWTLITAEKAQDRTVRSKAIIPAQKDLVLDASCVQSSQCGMMTPGGRHTVRMLPLQIRREAYAKRDIGGCNHLWEALRKYNEARGLPGDYLETFFKNFQGQMDQFVAEFELVPHQRGAIVLVNDQVAGIEIAANPMAFSAQWEMLIRDCYGSEAIIKQSEYQDVNKTALFGQAETLEELAEKLEEIEKNELEFAESTVEALLDQDVQHDHSRQKASGLEVIDIETGDYVGQAVKKGQDIIDLTLLSREITKRGFRFRKN